MGREDVPAEPLVSECFLPINNHFTIGYLNGPLRAGSVACSFLPCFHCDRRLTAVSSGERSEPAVSRGQARGSAIAAPGVGRHLRGRSAEKKAPFEQCTGRQRDSAGERAVMIRGNVCGIRRGLAADEILTGRAVNVEGDEDLAGRPGADVFDHSADRNLAEVGQ